MTKGNVNPRSLDTALRRLDKGGYLRGRNNSDYYDAVRSANMFSDVVGDSGTSTRSWAAMLASNPQMALQALALRPVAKQYLKSGGSPAAMALMGAVPGSARGGAVGAGAGRGLLGLDE